MNQKLNGGSSPYIGQWWLKSAARRQSVIGAQWGKPVKLRHMVGQKYDHRAKNKKYTTPLPY